MYLFFIRLALAKLQQLLETQVALEETSLRIAALEGQFALAERAAEMAHYAPQAPSDQHPTMQRLTQLNAQDQFLSNQLAQQLQTRNTVAGEYKQLILAIEQQLQPVA